MLLQRACGAESQVKNRLANGPLRVQSNEMNRYVRNVPQVMLRVFCNVMVCVNHQGYDSILLSARSLYRESRWYRG